MRCWYTVGQHGSWSRPRLSGRLCAMVRVMLPTWRRPPIDELVDESRSTNAQRDLGKKFQKITCFVSSEIIPCCQTASPLITTLSSLAVLFVFGYLATYSGTSINFSPRSMSLAEAQEARKARLEALRKRKAGEGVLTQYVHASFCVDFPRIKNRDTESRL